MKYRALMHSSNLIKKYIDTFIIQLVGTGYMHSLIIISAILLTILFSICISAGNNVLLMFIFVGSFCITLVNILVIHIFIYDKCHLVYPSYRSMWIIPICSSSGMPNGEKPKIDLLDNNKITYCGRSSPSDSYSSNSISLSDVQNKTSVVDAISTSNMNDILFSSILNYGVSMYIIIILLLLFDLAISSNPTHFTKRISGILQPLHVFFGTIFIEPFFSIPGGLLMKIILSVLVILRFFIFYTFIVVWILRFIGIM